MESGRRMKIKAVSGITLTMLLISILTLALKITPVQADQTIIHVGDLIIAGNQTFIIENCTYIQIGDIVVKDNAALIISDSKLILNLSVHHEYSILVHNNATILSQNSTITSNSTLIFDIHFSQSSYGLFNYSNVSPSNYIRGFDYSVISIVNSQADVVQSYGYSNVVIRSSVLWGAGCIAWEMSYPHVSIFDSKLESVNIHPQGTSVTVTGLQNGYIAYFNTYNNFTTSEGWVGNATIVNSDVRLGIGLAFTDSTANISQSILSYMDALDDSHVYIYKSTVTVQATVRHNSRVTINGCHVWMFNPWYDSIAVIIDSVIEIFGTGYGNPTLFVSDSTLNNWEAKDFFGKMSFDEVTVGDIREIATSQFYIYGNVTFPSHVDHWENSNATRNFNVIVIDERGYPLAYAELKLFDQNDAVVWSGLSDSYGKANFNLTSSDGNYTDTLRLEAIKGTSFSAENVTFLSETPIKMVLLSPPSGMSADLIRHGAWPEHHRFVLSRDGDTSVDDRHGTPGYQTLYSMVKNTGNVTISAEIYKVVWNLTTPTGMISYETVGTVDLAPKSVTTLTFNVPDSELSVGKYYVEAKCHYYGIAGETTKAFTFKVAK